MTTHALVPASSPSPAPSAAPERDPHVFTDRLAISLDLRIGKTEVSLAAGCIERLDVQATTYDFSVEVAFVVSSTQQEDPLFPALSSGDPAVASLTITNGNEQIVDPKAPAWKLVGPVTERWVREIVSDQRDGDPVVFRHYTLRFFDPARVYWGEHRPLELHTGVSVKQVLAQHLAAGMLLDIPWPRMGEAQDMIAVGPGAEGDASFYDWVMAYVHDHHGLVELDASTGTYRFSAEKSRGAKPILISSDEIAAVETMIAPPLRRSAAVVNAAVAAIPKDKKLQNPHAVAGVRRDALVRTQILPPMERRAAVESARLAPPEPGAEFWLCRLPPALPVAPGSMITLGSELGDRVYPAKKSYRVISARLSTRPVGELDDAALDDDSASHRIRLQLGLEQARDPTRRLPSFRRPAYPILVEGQVLSAVGEDDQRTFHVTEAKEGAEERVRVQVPLWSKIVGVPFEPGHVPGHFFFPPYRGQRVLLALYLDRAALVANLDWALRLPKDSQGNQLVLGKRARDETLLQHRYVEGKPTLSIGRRLARDVQTVVVSEGTIRIEVQEEKGQDAPPARHNLKPSVEAAKERTAAEVRRNVGGATRRFEGAKAETSARLDGALGELDAGLEQAEARLSATIDEAKEELSSMMSEATLATARIEAQLASAEAELDAALS